jgi:Peroxisomal membrane protein (Pex16)
MRKANRAFNIEDETDIAMQWSQMTCNEDDDDDGEEEQQEYGSSNSNNVNVAQSSSSLSSVASWWHRLQSGYESLVVRHYDKLSYVEMSLQGLVYALPARLKDAQWKSEASYTFIGLVQLVNDLILYKHIKNYCDTLRLNADSAVQGEKLAQRAGLLSSRVELVVKMLAALQSVQLLCEMVAKSRWHRKRVTMLIFAIESVKAAMRLVLLARSGGDATTLVEQSLPARQADALAELPDDIVQWPQVRAGAGKRASRFESVHGSGDGDSSSSLLDAIVQLPVELASSAVSWLRFVGGSSAASSQQQQQRQRQRRAPTASSTAAAAAERHRRRGSEKGRTIVDQMTPELLSSPGNLQPRLSKLQYLFGELLHIGRPLIFVAAQYVWGTMSWRALALSLAVDAWSRACKGDLEFASEEEAAEVRRRVSAWLWHLLRNPAGTKFIAVVTYVLTKLRMPSFVINLFDSFARLYVDHYFYTCAN